MNLFTDRVRIEQLEKEVQNLKKENKIIGEVYYEYLYAGQKEQCWLKFTKQELIDKVKDNFKIGIEWEFLPKWFNKDDVIIYDEINPLNKIIKQIKNKREKNNGHISKKEQ